MISYGQHSVTDLFFYNDNKHTVHLVEIDDVIQGKFIALYINGGLQFTTYSIERYHEILFGSLIRSFSESSKILVLGGGDGLGVDFLLKYGKDSVKRVTIVDISEAVIWMSKHHPKMTQLNHNSLRDECIDICIGDALDFVEHSNETYDIIVCDYTYPTDTLSQKLYNTDHWKRVHNLCKKTWSIQLGSPSMYTEYQVQMVEELVDSFDYIWFVYAYIHHLGDSLFAFISRDEESHNTLQENLSQIPRICLWSKQAIFNELRDVCVKKL
jgi:predicted membrane-bound spermidine synthase